MASPTRTTVIRILLSDESTAVSQGLCRLLDRSEDFEVVALADSAESVIEQAALLQPDVAVIDSRLLSGDGTDICARVRTVSITTQCIIHAPSATNGRLPAAAAAEVLKELRVEQLARTIRSFAQQSR